MHEHNNGHDHPHEHEHEHKHKHNSTLSTDRLKVLLPHLQKHNKDHIQDMKKWLGQLESAELKEIADEFRKIIQLSEEIDKSFETALSKL